MLLGSVPVSPMLPEAQATLQHPVRDMRRGLTLSWPLVMLEAAIVAIPGTRLTPHFVYPAPNSAVTPRNMQIAGVELRILVMRVLWKWTADWLL